MVLWCCFIFIINGYGLFRVCITVRADEFVRGDGYYQSSLGNPISRAEGCLLVVGRVFGG
jgi:hypothetical protein